MSGKISRLRELYREGGFERVIRGIRDYVYYSLFSTLLPNKTYRDRRADIDERWEFIEPYIDNSTRLLDIGCAEGYYTTKAAESGAFAIGVDIRPERLENAREKYGFPEQVGFVKWEISPENIHKLPNMDVMLLLTVQHHWEEAFGLAVSEEMFQYVMDRCELLIYEPPGDRPVLKHKDGTLDYNDSINFYTARLKALYGDSIEIEEVMLTEFRVDKEKHLDRKDPVFAIDTSEFSLVDAPTHST